MAALDGDLLILGVGGKMGPSLARLARRAIDQASARKRVVAVARFTNGDLPAALAAQGIETIEAEDIPGVRRCHIFDPFGNRIELVAG